MTQKVAVISGATGALGGAVARGLAARPDESWHIVALGRNKRKLERLDDDLGKLNTPATLVPFDFTGDVALLADLGLQIGNRFGKIDTLVLSAAMLGPLMPVQQMETSTLQRIMQVNCWAQQALLAACDPWLRRASQATVSFIDCTLGMDEPAYWAGYHASKAALLAVGGAYQRENLHGTIETNLFDPGPFASTLHTDAFPGIDPADLPTAESVAADLLHLIRDYPSKRTGSSASSG